MSYCVCKSNLILSRGMEAFCIYEHLNIEGQVYIDWLPQSVGNKLFMPEPTAFKTTDAGSCNKEVKMENWKLLDERQWKYNLKQSQKFNY